MNGENFLTTTAIAYGVLLIATMLMIIIYLLSSKQKKS